MNDDHTYNPIQWRVALGAILFYVLLPASAIALLLLGIYLMLAQKGRW